MTMEERIAALEEDKRALEIENEALRVEIAQVKRRFHAWRKMGEKQMAALNEEIRRLKFVGGKPWWRTAVAYWAGIAASLAVAGVAIMKIIGWVRYYAG